VGGGLPLGIVEVVECGERQGDDASTLAGNGSRILNVWIIFPSAVNESRTRNTREGTPACHALRTRI
jgi:hypothetical protein